MRYSKHKYMYVVVESKCCYSIALLIYLFRRVYISSGTHLWGLPEKRVTRVECKNDGLP